MRGKGLAYRHERIPLIAHQMRHYVNVLAPHPTSFALGHPVLALNDGENRHLRAPWLAFAGLPEVWTIGILSRATVDIDSSISTVPSADARGSPTAAGHGQCAGRWPSPPYYSLQDRDFAG